MKRMEIIANNSVETDIIEALENVIPNFYYSLLPEIHGKGKTRYKLGTDVWPELIFLVISFVDDSIAVKAKEILIKLKNEFPNEGIKYFIMEAELL